MEVRDEVMKALFPMVITFEVRHTLVRSLLPDSHGSLYKRKVCLLNPKSYFDKHYPPQEHPYKKNYILQMIMIIVIF